jgi:hypothetical protein
MATFPAYAVLLKDGFSRQRESAVERTPMEDGMQKQLRTKSRVLLKRPLTYGFASLADYNSFITWFQTDVDYGAMWFDWTDPVDSTLKTARIEGGQLRDERPDNATLTYWVVTFTLETWG